MKAKKVYEFQQGQDPYDTMGLSNLPKKIKFIKEVYSVGVYDPRWSLIPSSREWMTEDEYDMAKAKRRLSLNGSYDYFWRNSEWELLYEKENETYIEYKRIDGNKIQGLDKADIKSFLDKKIIIRI
jgi:hypothetical protein